MIDYREIRAADMPAVKALYEEQGWTAYLNDDDRLLRAWDGSLFARGAYDGGKLVGFVRCLGDGAHTVLIQDLLVCDAYRRMGVGRALLETVLDNYADVRQVFVVTDTDSEDALAFYHALGFVPLSSGGMISLFRY